MLRAPGRRRARHPCGGSAHVAGAVPGGRRRARPCAGRSMVALATLLGADLVTADRDCARFTGLRWRLPCWGRAAPACAVSPTPAPHVSRQEGRDRGHRPAASTAARVVDQEGGSRPHVPPSGLTPLDPGEIASSQRLTSIIDELTLEADVVLVDTPAATMAARIATAATRGRWRPARAEGSRGAARHGLPRCVSLGRARLGAACASCAAAVYPVE